MNVEPDGRETQKCANTDSKAKPQQNKQRTHTKKEQIKELQKLREKEWKRRTKGKKIDRGTDQQYICIQYRL